MELRETAVLLSLAMTVPTLFGCVGVLWLWRAASWSAWFLRHKTETHYFILGVAIGFVGALFDNIYWGLAWAADYFNHPTRDLLFDNGALPNIFFRQLATALAAGFHIRAAVESNSRAFRILVFGGWAIGLVVAIPLMLVR